MDKVLSNDLKVQKKLAQTAKRIKKKREDKAAAAKEAEEFDELKKLLSEIDEPGGSSQPIKSDWNLPALEIELIPPSAPGKVIFNKDNLFCLFDEQSLELKTFISSRSKSAFVRNVLNETEDTFRNILLHSSNIEILHPTNEENRDLSLYVLNLLSVHSNPRLVRSCSSFLRHHPVDLSSEDILPILVNLGASPNLLVDGGFKVDTSRFKRREGREGPPRDEFPFFNLEMVGECLLSCLSSGHLCLNDTTPLLLRALTKLTLDPLIRCCPLLTVYSLVVSALAAELLPVLGLEKVTNSLHLSEEHLSSQLEVVRSLLLPSSQNIQQALLLRSIHFLLKSEDPLYDTLPIQVRHVKQIIAELRHRDRSLLQLFFILQLITSILPSITATLQDSREISVQLTALETKILCEKDSADLVRVKSAVAKVRSLATIRAGSQCDFAPRYRVSPRKNRAK